ncbi:MAG: hypothetical protein GY832_08520 [Chloroflexi bacterium]|nr:hypothetical protein [Chloroflexota bacterium]
MKRTQKLLVPILTVSLVTLVVGAIALRNAAPTVAQTSGNYNLEWHVVGGGGGLVSSASYAVNSTAGQGAASPPYSTGSHYVVSGGYLFFPLYRIYLPLVMKR